MTNARKLLEKVRNNQQNWRIEQLETIVQKFGVDIRKSGGSHVVFSHKKWVEILCVPAHKPVKQVYVKKLLALLEILESDVHD